MPDRDDPTDVFPMSTVVERTSSRLPSISTTIVWCLALGSLGVLVAYMLQPGPWRWADLVAIDGLTALTWCGVTLLSGIVHSYSRRYLDGDRGIERFFGCALAFTAAVMLLVAADHLVLFNIAWLLMGLTMAELIGHVRGWRQARQARSIARRTFVGSSALLALAFGVIWSNTGAVSIGEIGRIAGDLGQASGLLVTASLLGAALIQSALIPFHGWLLSSMTAPTPASALMHAGFVNAGGLLFARFYPLFAGEAIAASAVVALGALSAIGGKLLKSVRPDVKSQLGCSTVGQMGFMVMQAGLGFVAAAVTHLILHGFYKAYLFLSSGERVEQTVPFEEDSAATGTVPRVTAVLLAAVGGALFLWLTGKPFGLNGGALLALLVALAMYRATREMAGRIELAGLLRYAVAPAIFLAAIGTYAGIYLGVAGLMNFEPIEIGVGELSTGYGLLVVLFAATYLLVETESYKFSDRLYVKLLNSSTPDRKTLLTSKEDYRDC